jgi:hypothetical protein
VVFREHSNLDAWLNPRTFLGVLVAIAGLAVGAAALVAVVYSAAMAPFGPAPPFDPGCSATDVICSAWSEFRREHPYPYQAISIKPLGERMFALILSEPAPRTSKEELLKLLQVAFGSDFRAAERKRWFIGEDGWVEDIVIHVRANEAFEDDPLRDPLLRDRVALLHSALYGTTFGGDLEVVHGGDVNRASTIATPRVSLLELRTWLADPALLWRRVNTDGSTRKNWPTLAADHEQGTWISADGTLVMLTFPIAILTAAQSDPAALEPLRAPVRELAVASDVVFGGAWTDEQVAILARPRTRPLSVVPPLRFETIAMLATQSGARLEQSFVTDSVFAGRLNAGRDAWKEWAPVYVSAPIVDTELGTLMILADQILKSWSEAGFIEYRYFTYPKPRSFPFGEGPLSEILRERLRIPETLFNWSTTGSAVVAHTDGFKALVVGRAGALPVSYGGRWNGSRPMRDLLAYEEQGWRYFAAQHDQILARVAQYITLFQLFRAIDMDRAPEHTVTTPVHTAEPRAAANAVLVRETEALLRAIAEPPPAAPRDELRDSAREEFARVRASRPDLTDTELAAMLANRFSPEVMRVRERLHAGVVREHAAVRAAEAEHLKLARSTDPAAAAAANIALDARRNVLQATQRRAAAFDAVLHSLRRKVARVAAQNSDTSDVLRRYVAASAYEPSGSIKTPSVVVSWSRREGLSNRGGHSLQASALHFETSPDVRDISTARGAGGLVVRYPVAYAAAVESDAAAIARAMEHRGERKAVATLPAVPASRTRRAALDLPADASAVDLPSAVGRLGRTPDPRKEPVVASLEAYAQQSNCCIYIGSDATRGTHLVEPPSKPEISATTEIRDRITLLDMLQPRLRTKPVVLIDVPESDVAAVALDLATTDPADRGRLESLAKFLGAATQTDSGRLSAIAHRDLAGKPVVLRTEARVPRPGEASLVARSGIPEPKQHWTAIQAVDLQGRALQGALQEISWSNSSDGTPTAIGLTLRGTHLVIVAGARKMPGRGESLLEVDARIRASMKRNTSMAQYLMTMYSELSRQRTPPQRIAFMIRDDSGTAVLSGIGPAVPVAASSQ